MTSHHGRSTGLRIFSTEVLTYDLVHDSQNAGEKAAVTLTDGTSALDQANRPTESELFREITRIAAGRGDPHVGTQ